MTNYSTIRYQPPAASTTVVSDMNALIALSGMSNGDQVLVQSNLNLYMYSGSGFYKIATILNDSPSAITGVDGSYELAVDGSPTTITAVSTDPEGFPLTWSYSTSGLGSIATISNTNGVFTITPTTNTSYSGTFTLTISATDGVNGAVSATSNLTLNFIVGVTNSRYTTLLATATSLGDNNNITDSSSSNHTITVNDGAHAGTFSPYRHGGYSTYFGTGGSEILVVTGTKSALGASNQDFSISAWLYPNANTDKFIYSVNDQTLNQAGWHDIYLNGSGKLTFRIQDTSSLGSLTSTSTIPVGAWTHFLINRSSNITKLYINGVEEASSNTMNNSLYVGASNAPAIGARWFYNADTPTPSLDFEGYITDLHVQTAAVSTPTAVPTERAVVTSNTWLLTCHLPYFKDSSTNSYSITASGGVSVSPKSVFDNLEYSVTDYGGSVYFDGTGDSLEIPQSTNIGAFGTNDFTVQLWYYTDHNGSTDYLFDFRQYGGNGNYLMCHKNSGNKIVVYGGGSNRITGTQDISIGQWFFITIHRDNGSLKLFVNGQQDGSTYSDSINYVAAGSGNFMIGKNNGGANYNMEGYLSDIRVTHGSALDGTIVPTAPLSSSGANLHIKGTDASIIDKSQRYNIDLTNTSIAGSSTAKTDGAWAGERSIYIDSRASSSDIITFPAGVLDASKPFTIEMWLRTTYGSTCGFWGIYQDTQNEMRLKMKSNDWVELYHRGSGASSSEVNGGSNTYKLNTSDFYHIAVTRDANGVFYLHQNGIKVFNFTENGIFDSSALEFKLGTDTSGTNQYMDGYIQDFRISQGLARYTADDETANIPSGPLEG